MQSRGSARPQVPPSPGPTILHIILRCDGPSSGEQTLSALSTTYVIVTDVTDQMVCNMGVEYRPVQACAAAAGFKAVVPMVYYGTRPISKLGPRPLPLASRGAMQAAAVGWYPEKVTLKTACSHELWSFMMRCSAGMPEVRLRYSHITTREQ